MRKLQPVGWGGVGGWGGGGVGEAWRECEDEGEGCYFPGSRRKE